MSCGLSAGAVLCPVLQRVVHSRASGTVSEGTQLHLFQALRSALVPACPWVSSRWQAQLSFGQESAPLSGRGLGVEWFSGNPVSSGAQGILRMAAKLLEMPASQGESLVLF